MKKNSGPSIVTALVAAGVAILVGILAFLKFIPDHVLIQLGFDWKEVGNQLEETQENRAPIWIECLFWFLPYKYNNDKILHRTRRKILDYPSV